MAKLYVEKLTTLINAIDLATKISYSLEVKHFFSGAALYSDGTICASWTPVGLAFKLPKEDVAELIGNGRAKPLKYFPKGHIKKGYALFENPDNFPSDHWNSYFLVAAQRI